MEYDMKMTDSYADLTAALVAVQREEKTMDNSPIAGMEDYSAGASNMAMALSQHLTEAIVNGQKRRTELAALVVVKGLMGQLAWLRAKGYDVPTIAVATFGPGQTFEIEGVLRAEPVHLDTSGGSRVVGDLQQPEVTLGAAGTEAVKPDWLGVPNPWAAYVRGCADGMSQLHEGPMRSILMDIASELEDITPPEDPRIPELNARLERLLAHQTRHLTDLQSIRSVMGLADGVDIATGVQRLREANAKLQGLLNNLGDMFKVRVGDDIVQGIRQAVGYQEGRVKYLMDEAKRTSQFTQELRTALHEHAYDSWQAASAMQKALESYDLELHAMQRARYDHAHVAANASALDQQYGRVNLHTVYADPSIPASGVTLPTEDGEHLEGALRVMVYKAGEWVPYHCPDFQKMIMTADCTTGMVDMGAGVSEHDVGSARDDFVDAPSYDNLDAAIIDLGNEVHRAMADPDDAQAELLTVVKEALKRWGGPEHTPFSHTTLPDNLGWTVDQLAYHLKSRLHDKFAEGKKGWQDLSVDELMGCYLRHAVGGHVLDAAAYLAMLHVKGQNTTYLVEPWHGKKLMRALVDSIEYDHTFGHASARTDAMADKAVSMFEAAVLVARQNGARTEPSLWRKLWGNVQNVVSSLR